jgi:gliding motility-associated lipoprotein GldH
MKRLIFLLLPVVLLTSCGPRKIFEDHIKTKNLSWNRFDVYEFEVPIENISKGYDLVFALRHITDIPYDKLSINLAFETPIGERRSRDFTVTIRDKEGNLLGDGLGELWDLEKTLWENFQFRETGICKIELRNRMTKLETLGILEVGFIVRESRAKD